MAARAIKNAAVAKFGRHGCMKIGKMIKAACRPDCGQIRCVEAEEIYAGLASVDHVRANVQFREPRESRQGRECVAANATHVKRGNPNPALAIKRVERHLWRDESPHLWSGNRPV